MIITYVVRETTVEDLIQAVLSLVNCFIIVWTQDTVASLFRDEIVCVRHGVNSAAPWVSNPSIAGSRHPIRLRVTTIEVFSRAFVPLIRFTHLERIMSNK